ncbi:MAG: hypothetical protein JXB05_10000 [Myxococcaceae bacterium]|nr:hypothetical protein [Myxococcaceae bacterium]
MFEIISALDSGVAWGPADLYDARCISAGAKEIIPKSFVGRGRPFAPDSLAEVKRLMDHCFGQSIDLVKSPESLSEAERPFEFGSRPIIDRAGLPPARGPENGTINSALGAYRSLGREIENVRLWLGSLSEKLADVTGKALLALFRWRSAAAAAHLAFGDSQCCIPVWAVALQDISSGQFVYLRKNHGTPGERLLRFIISFRELTLAIVKVGSGAVQ